MTLDTDARLWLRNAGTIQQDDALVVRHNDYNTTNPAFVPVAETEPATIATVAEFDESYVAYDKRVYRFDAEATDIVRAPVEDRDFAVGPGAPYDPAYVVQENSWPDASYIIYFDNRLWAFGMRSDPFGIRWSAPTPYYRVWPSISREVLMEDDNSRITGGAALGEHMVVFKQDSIWIMVDIGDNSIGLREYVPKRVVAGVGCVANSSIEKIRGRLVFLSEDGIYAFDGTPNIEKLSDRVQTSISKINHGRRPFCASAHWRKNSLYLLSVSTNGDIDNDLTFVWDYKNDAWWLWDSIDARHWLVDEGAYDQEIVYFGDSYGRIYQLDNGRDDHGATIPISLRTHRFGRDDDTRKQLREVRVESSNKTNTLTVEPLVNDEVPATAADLSMVDVSETVVAPNGPYYERRRERRQGWFASKEFDWVQIDVTHAQKPSWFRMASIRLGYLFKGKR
jgi:hypothetical protein